MNEQKELKDCTEVELKAAAYERVYLVSRYNMELQAIEQELQKRSKVAVVPPKVKKEK